MKDMKPMLAATIDDAAKQIKFPVFASPKLDGVRAIISGGVVLSRQLKPIPNYYVQKLFSKLPTGPDGELILGAPNDNPYLRTVSAVMTMTGELDVKYHVFDNFTIDLGFEPRYVQLMNFVLGSEPRNVVLVPHKLIRNLDDLLSFEEEQVQAGFEGVMVRSLNGPYKNGRSTLKEGYLLKLKRFLDSEAVVLDTYERMHNANEATTNKLGYTERSSHQENLVGHGDLGGLEVMDVHTRQLFSIGTGFTGAQRVEFWGIRDSLVGRTVKYKFFPSGSLDRPRFPVFLGWRDPIDMEAV